MIKNINKVKTENNLYKKYFKHIEQFFIRFTNKYNEHDISQMCNDVFIKLNNNFNKLKDVDDELYIKKWLHTTCKNIKIDFDRKNNSEFSRVYVIDNNLYYDHAVDDNIDTYNRLLKLNNKFLNGYIELKDKGFKNKEISKILKISERNLYRKLQNIKENVSK